jgi:hypothetical protein
MPLATSRLRTHPVAWIGGSVLILLIDYLTGPFIQFPLLFVLPVAVATLTHGLAVGLVVALLLPLIHLSFFSVWELPSTWLIEGINTGVDVVVLGGFAVLLDRLHAQQQAIRVLQGLLPICAFCKRIREGSEWRKLETFIAERSSARFSHTFCEECARTHYPGLVD